MLTQDELLEIKATVNLLNNHLQQISGYAARSAKLSEGNPIAHDYILNIIESNEKASLLVTELLNEFYNLASSGKAAAAEPTADSAERPPQTTRVVASPFSHARLTGFGAPSPSASEGPAGPVVEVPAPQSFSSPAAQGSIPPACPEERLVPVPIHPDVPIENPGGSGALILLVDDDEHVLLLAKMMLVEAGYRVIACAGGVEALEIFEKIPTEIDLVILDYAMPIMDGGEVFEELRAIHSGVMVLLSSGFADQTRLNQMLSRGLRGFIAKPYTMEKMLLQVSTALKKHS